MSIVTEKDSDSVQHAGPPAGVQIVSESFTDDRKPGKVIGTSAAGGAVRLGRDAEHQVAIDHGALRFQPLVVPGWGRQGISYGPFRREPGLVLAVSITNGHNTSQGSPIPEDLARRIYRWLRGPGIDPWPRRMLALALAPRKRATLRRLWWWARSTQKTYRKPNIEENLAVGWFSSEGPINPLAEGCGFIVHAAEGENGELWARVGRRCLSAFRRLKNVRVDYVVALRERGAVYYAASTEGAHGLAGFPMMRPIAVDPYDTTDTLYAGVHQSALGQIGFRVDTRVHEVRVARLPELASRFGLAHAADPLSGEPIAGETAAAGGRWRVLRRPIPEAAADLAEEKPGIYAILDPGRPTALVHVLIDTQDGAGACGLVWRVEDENGFLHLAVSGEACTLVRVESGIATLLATSTEHHLDRNATHSLQVLDWDGQVSCHLDGNCLFHVRLEGKNLENATGVGVWSSGTAGMHVRDFEAHPRDVPIPATIRFGAHWMRSGEKVVFSDAFTRSPGELDRRAPDIGDGEWERTVGAGAIEVDAKGGAHVCATVENPNPGRTFYTLPWNQTDFADVEVVIKPPGEQRGEGHCSRGGIVFWQDRDNYICVTTWLDDIYPGASISVFIKRFGFEELYDAVWTNVADKVVWGKRFRLRTAFDGDRFVTFVDDEPIMQRGLSDIYPGDPRLRISRVGLAVNWEFGDDTGSVFEMFTAR